MAFPVSDCNSKMGNTERGFKGKHQEFPFNVFNFMNLCDKRRSPGSTRYINLVQVTDEALVTHSNLVTYESCMCMWTRETS